MGIVSVTTGVPGSGKSYLRCARFLVDEFLLSHSGLFISNFPVNVKEISSYLAEKCSRMGRFAKSSCVFWSTNEADFSSRIISIPQDDILKLRNGIITPTDYFSRFELEDGHISLDEIHEIIRTNSNPAVLANWADFLGTIRHRGCEIEGITQDLSQIDDSFLSRASVRIELVSLADIRDPYLGIPLDDWLELYAAFSGKYLNCIGYNELRKSSNGRWKVSYFKRVVLDDRYFKFYDSYNRVDYKESSSSPFPNFKK